MSPNEKQALVGLTLKPEWQTFLKMCDNWKILIIQKGLVGGSSAADLVNVQAQVRAIAVLKTFQNKYKHLYEKPNQITEEDTATTVPL